MCALLRPPQDARRSQPTSPTAEPVSGARQSTPGTIRTGACRPGPVHHQVAEPPLRACQPAWSCSYSLPTCCWRAGTSVPRLCLFPFFLRFDLELPDGNRQVRGSPSWGRLAPPPGAALSLRIPALTWGLPLPMRLGTGKGSHALAPSSRCGRDLGRGGRAGGGFRKSQVGGASLWDPSDWEG